jgi:uncharacterized protein YjiS (DUF1127 family)
MKNERTDTPNDETPSLSEDLADRIMASLAGGLGTKSKPSGTDKESVPKKSLSARQKKLLTALMKTSDVQAACKAAGVGRTAAYGWLKNSDFRNELNRLRDNALSDALTHIKTYTAQAVDQLALLMQSQNEGLRRQACNDILSHSINIRTKETLDKRLKAVEDVIGKRFW